MYFNTTYIFQTYLNTKYKIHIKNLIALVITLFFFAFIYVYLSYKSFKQ